MPKNIPSPINTGETSSSPSPQTSTEATVGKWQQKDVKESKPGDNTLIPKRRESESDSDSGIGTPVRERSITPFSDDSFPETARSFDFDSNGLFSPAPDSKPDNNSATLSLEVRAGDGSHGTVYKVATKDSNDHKHHLALKTSRDEKSANNELRIMKQLKDHPSIIKCLGEAEVDGESGILFEFVSGPSFITLKNKLMSSPMPTEELINVLKYLEQQQLEAMAAAGECGVIHADLKPSNMLLDTETGILKVIDFGQGCIEGEDFDPGHVDYAAPETLKHMGKRDDGPKASVTMDSYSLGQMLYQTITGAADGMGEPYMFGVSFAGKESNRDVKLFQTVMAMMPHQSLEKQGTPHRVFPNSLEFVRKQALMIARRQLGDADEATLQDSAKKLEPELQEVYSLVNDLMRLNPEKRITAREALEHSWFKRNPADPKMAMDTLTRLFA